MDSVSRTLGILPILQGFSNLQEKIHSLRHYRKEVKWLRIRVKGQVRCFNQQINHLAIDTFGNRKAQSLLIRDDDHAHWKNKDLDGPLKRHMGELLDEFIGAIGKVKAALEQIEAKLAIFAPPDVMSPLFKVTKDEFRIAFRKEKYKEDIDNIKEWIAVLKRIRKSAHAKRKQSAAKAKETQKEQNEPMAGLFAEFNDVTTVRQYKAIWRLSLEFQALLQQQWSCCDRSHSYHSGRLFLRCIPQRNCIAWLLEYPGTHGLTSPSNRLLFNVSSQQLGLMTPMESPDLNSSKYFDGPTSKRQKISSQGYFIAEKSEASDFGNEYHGSDAASSEDMGSLCRQLEACSVTLTPRRREKFMFEPKPAETLNPGGWDTYEITSLIELLNHQVRDVIKERGRIQLALALVRGTLMNHSTLGWPQGCVMEGISFFKKLDADVDVSALLNTLNIQMQVGNSLASDTNMEGNSVTVSEDELQYKFGIQNQVLYRLGVALLSIGLWSKVGWEDVEAVRRKADALDSLGGRAFRDAVKRLIRGNFSVDMVDLSNERLQVEILRLVIVPLERLAELFRQAEPESWPGQATPNWSGGTNRPVFADGFVSSPIERIDERMDEEPPHYDLDNRHTLSDQKPTGTKRISDRAFRVKGIPSEYNKNDIVRFLKSKLNLDDSTLVNIRSLANSHERRAKVAVVSFDYLPADLESDNPGKEHWSLHENTVGNDLTIDNHFRGLTILYAPEDGNDHKIDICAVAGLGANAWGSFKAHDEPWMWLLDSLSKEFPYARIMIYGSDTKLPGNKSVQNLEDLADGLLSTMTMLRKRSTTLYSSNSEDLTAWVERQRFSSTPLIFIAHSLGGLIVREAMVEAHNRSDNNDDSGYSSFLSCIHGALFFGVPCHGMQTSAIEAMVKSQPNSSLLDSLKAESPTLQKLGRNFDREFGSGDKPKDIFYFFETKESPSARQDPTIGKWKMDGPDCMLVSRNSATAGLVSTMKSNITKPLNRTHSDLVKFAKADDEYHFVLEILEEMMGRAIRVGRRGTGSTV